MTFYRRQRMLFTQRKRIDPWTVAILILLGLWIAAEAKWRI